MDLILDVNIQIYPVDLGKILTAFVQDGCYKKSYFEIMLSS